MDNKELLDIISGGETSMVQFKESWSSDESIEKEIVAFSNSLGGVIIFGVEDKTGLICGLSFEQRNNYEKKISQLAESINPKVYCITEIHEYLVEGVKKFVLAIHLKNGLDKPYKTKKGEIYVKQGANKILIKDNSEIMKLFQSSRNLFADEMEVYGTSIMDLKEENFREYFNKEFNDTIENKGLTIEKALIAKRILSNNQLTLAGLLFFGKEPQNFKPLFTIKLVSFFGNDVSDNKYRSKPNDLTGTIPNIFEKSINFITSSLHYIQSGESFNSQGKMEISRIAIEELVLNAMVHRDYFKISPIRIFIFDDRLEIISPGKLPNSLTIENIKYGNSIYRNPLIVSISSKLLPFSGLGTGIKRALKEQPNIEFINDIENDNFKVIIPRVKIERFKS